MLYLCIKIFLVRILDVSLGTVRTILLVKGRKYTAAIVSFIEVSIWFTIVREALSTTTDSPWIVFAYAGGFATGTIIGSMISEKFIKGTFTLQVITDNNTSLVELIRNEGYAVSVINVKGRDADIAKYMLFIEIDRKNLGHLQGLIKKIDNDAFIVANETRYVENGFIKK